MTQLSVNQTSILIFLTIVATITSSTANRIQSASHVLLQASPANCSYSIQIETTCAPSTETKDHISVRFSDKAGNLVIVKHLKNPKLLYAPKGRKNPGGVYNGFQRCVIDMFEACGACMSQIVCSPYLKKFGSDEWRPGWVKVLHRWDDGILATVSHTFYFRTFVLETIWYGFDYCHSRENLIPNIPSFHGEKNYNVPRKLSQPLI